MLRILTVVGAALAGTMAMAEIKTMDVEYTSNGEAMLGYVAYDDSKPGPKPAVMIVHDWNGLDGYEKGRARQLAEMGYVAFAVDIYGKNSRPKSQAENGQQAGKYRADVPLFRKRLADGHAAMIKQPGADATKTAAMGYCFGGGAVLEMARAGMPVKGVVSFHGSLSTNMRTAEGAQIAAKVLVCHAIQDPSVPWNHVTDFVTEMNGAKADYQILTFNESVHPFTVPGPSYRADADRRSWDSMKQFFQEIFK